MLRGDVLEARKMIEPSRDIIAFLRTNLEGAKAKALILRENKKQAREQQIALTNSQKGLSRRNAGEGGGYMSSSGKSEDSYDDKEYEEETAGSEANW